MAAGHLMTMEEHRSKLVSLTTPNKSSIYSIALSNTSQVIRVRPPLGPSDPGFDNIPQRFQRSMVQVTTPTSLGVDSPQGRKLFIFDRVFGEDVTQRGVWDYISDSVNSFVQGYNVSILAYGQSGAGKSYTMGTSGPREQSDPSAMGK
jgi:Kinesin motor domain